MRTPFTLTFALMFDSNGVQVRVPKVHGRSHTLAGGVLAIWIGACALMLGAPPVAAQSHAVSDSAMALNRAGRWAEAAVLARRYLDSARAGSPEETCRVRVMLAYAQLQLTQVDAARAALGAADSECEATNTRLEVASDFARLRQALGAQAASSDTSAGSPADGFWKVADPATLGLNVAALARHRAVCEQTGADACLVVYHDTLVQEWYSPRYGSPTYAMSSTKSITALVVGMLLADGKIRSIDDPVCAYLPLWCDGIRGRVTLRHLLNMTSGLPRMWADGVGGVGDKDPFVIRLVPTHEPGTVWAYSNEGAQLLSPILDVAAGEPIQDYAFRRLFGALGMRRTRLHLDEAHHAWTYADMETTARDLARIGLLMLHRGVWQGQRIISAQWIDSATHPSQTLNSRYGLLWWIDSEVKAFAAHGHLDTGVHIVPDLDLVVVRTQSKPFRGVKEGTYETVAVPLYPEFVPAGR